MSLKNANIVVTGASMGIGTAIAHRLASSGANIIAFARSEDKLQSLAQTIKKTTPNATVHTAVVDVTDHAAVTSAVTHAIEALGPIDVLVNNAGLALGKQSACTDCT
jgi:3-hydroxy acid dehydrogenase/malonic semialdehyde reductase